RGTEIERLVEDKPAGNRPALGFAGAGHVLPGLLVVFAVVGREIAGDFRRAQEIVDLLVVVEARIVAETDVRHVLRLPKLWAEPTADELRIAVQRVDHRLMILYAERRDIGRRMLEIGRHAHFRNRDNGLFEKR